MELWFKYACNGDTYSGGFAHGADEAMVMQTKVSWSSLVRELAARLRQLGEDTELYVHRIDHQMLIPTKVPPEVVALFCHDPILAIRQWTVEVSEEVARRIPPPFVCGHEAIAGMFGEEVYLAMSRVGRVESFLTAVMEPQAALEVPLRIVSRNWCLCSVQAVLDKHAEVSEFYFPKPWSSPTGWIPRDVLIQKLEAFRASKKAASQLWPVQ